MVALTVGEFKRQFSRLLQRVRNGERIEILYGKTKKPVAMLVPISDTHPSREIGILDGQVDFTETDNGKISEAEFLGIE